MMMEIFLNPDKAKQVGMSIEECYEKIDNYFFSKGVAKIDQGIYKGTNKDFSAFACAQTGFVDSKWFLKVVDEWYARYEGDTIEYREDLIESYYRIKKQSDEFFQKQKSVKLRYQ